MATTQELKSKFTSLLQQMFQLDQPELDFGIYRIMHARKDDINRFIEQDLPKKITEAFAGFEGMDKQQVAEELEKAKQGAQALGVDPSTVPRVQELEQQYNAKVDLTREEGEVYDALVTFFNRYYDEGDFISRRIYKDGTYAIPYNGEEVVLHWANKDQYYIKSSENLRDYTFRLNPHDEQNPMRVHFKLVDAEAGASNNNKEAEGKNRVFVLRQSEEQPAWSEVNVKNGDTETTELEIYFEFRVATENDWTDAVKASATAAAKKKPPTQDHLRQIAVELLIGEESNLPEKWRDPLSNSYVKANGETADYSLLQGQLNNYTKANKFDYFIHKDLGKFLRQELDFYIKNELMRWEDISANKANFAKLGPMFSKIEVIRQLGDAIITFLAQLEDFQKKLWLKKKFVTETQYCITLDRLQESPGLVEIALNNEDQRSEWVELFEVDLSDLDKVKSEGVEAVLVHQNYKFLVIDTKFFDETFKAELIANIDDLDDQLNGLLIHSENFQALNLIQERFKGQVKCIYIDPPYNTGNDDFIYKDSFQESSWLSLLEDRVSLSKGLLSDSGTFSMSIDLKELDKAVNLLDSCFGTENRKSNITIKRGSVTGAKVINPGVVNISENVLVYSNVSKVWEPNRAYRPKDYDKRYGQFILNVDEHYSNWKFITVLDAFSKEKNIEKSKLRKVLGDDYDQELFNFVVQNNRSIIRFAGLDENSVSQDAVDLKRESKKEPDKIFFLERENANDYYIKNGDVILFYRDRLQKIGEELQPAEPLSDIWDDVLPNDLHNEGGVTLRKGKKPEKLIHRVVESSTKKNEVVLDFFAGSGTTAAVCQKSGYKWINVEQGSYFDLKTLARIKNTLHGESSGISSITNWEGGGVFKYIRLESYEDTLGNLALNRPAQIQSDMFNSQNPDMDSAREDYLLNYMLEVESRGSASLLNIAQFTDPMAYQLKVRSAAGDETKLINVDLIETFNWLLGLQVEHIAAPIYFDAEFEQTDLGRWQASVKRAAEGQWWFRTVYGVNRKGQSVLIVWRNLPKTAAGADNGLVLDNAVLEAVMLDKLKIRLTESPDDEIELVYVNGDHNITVPKRKDGELLQARVQNIEETFHRLMFATDEGLI